MMERHAATGANAQPEVRGTGTEPRETCHLEGESGQPWGLGGMRAGKVDFLAN